MYLLRRLYEINSQSGDEETMRRFVRQQLAGTNVQIEEDPFGNLFLTRGSAGQYPCLAAHLDEVHAPAERTILIKDNMIRAVDTEGCPLGCGADDKNGIWIILKTLEETQIPLKAALFTAEETGCNGSKTCSHSFFDNVKFIIGLDRKGGHDLVTVGKETRISDDDYWDAAIVSRFGYQPVQGGMSDVVRLVIRGFGIPSCNISVGYYNPHKPEEYTIIPELQNAKAFAQALAISMTDRVEYIKEQLVASTKQLFLSLFDKMKSNAESREDGLKMLAASVEAFGELTVRRLCVEENEIYVADNSTDNEYCLYYDCYGSFYIVTTRHGETDTQFAW